MIYYLNSLPGGNTEFNFFKDIKSMMTNGKWETNEALSALSDIISMFNNYDNLGALCSHDQYDFSVPTSYDINYITGYSYGGNVGIAFSSAPFTLENDGKISFPANRYYFAVNNSGDMQNLMLNKGTTKTTNYSTSPITFSPASLSTVVNNIFYTSYDIKSPNEAYFIKKNIDLSDISIIRG